MEWPTFPGMTFEDICERTFDWASRRFIWTPDEVTCGQVDHWPSPEEIATAMAERNGVLFDDCDGFAAMCRHILKLNGIRSRLVLCWVENGGYHAVCEADGLILDNRQPAVRSTQDMERIGYVWDRMSGYETGDDWSSVNLR